VSIVVVFLVDVGGCICSSVWTIGSRLGYWRLIIARVSEMHVAYHKILEFVCYLHQRNSHQQRSSFFSLSLSLSLSSYLLLLILYWHVSAADLCVLDRMQGVYCRCRPCRRWWVYLFLSMDDWQPFHRLAFNHSACLRNARRISYEKSSCVLFTSAEQYPPLIGLLPPSHLLHLGCLVFYCVFSILSISSVTQKYPPQVRGVVVTQVVVISACKCLKSA
jgi:hypothetical protein